MYNRYVPQSDGTHRRRYIPDPPGTRQPTCEVPPPQPDADCHTPEPSPQQRPRPCHARQEQSIGGFLKNILPRDFDTGDLMIILLLLLMAGDCQEDQNWALLTLALYLFL